MTDTNQLGMASCLHGRWEIWDALSCVVPGQEANDATARPGRLLVLGHTLVILCQYRGIVHVILGRVQK
jgi:hypothetical protein